MADGPTDDLDYEIGYARPPVAHQFQKGSPSPNPRGRPRGSRNQKSWVRQIAAEVREYVEAGQRRRASTLELVLLAVRNAAARGDPRALNLYDYLTGEDASEQSSIPKGVFIVREAMTEEEWQIKYNPNYQR
ncbi:DUF5681 domain-containing protein [Sphingomonas caeni]|uniref:DUF5681 domain-containing protein n=1 Tax=Sphingomonas caeni TaxID=2984949 RepID=UPI00222F9420|nr:DUF5681 domain-containing protein [Sphingomonas caeni]